MIHADCDHSKCNPAIADCELTFLTRQEFDVSKAAQQHKDYEQCLRDLGVEVVSLQVRRDLPDAVFVEDAAVVVDEVAIVTRMGAKAREAETASVPSALAPYRRIEILTAPATLDGGDVMRVRRTLFVGTSKRTNKEGIAQLR